MQRSLNDTNNHQTETISKICGEKYHTTIKQDGHILREYGNATREELDELDADEPPPPPIVGGNKHSDFWKKLFS